MTTYIIKHKLSPLPLVITPVEGLSTAVKQFLKIRSVPAVLLFSHEPAGNDLSLGKIVEVI